MRRGGRQKLCSLYPREEFRPSEQSGGSGRQWRRLLIKLSEVYDTIQGSPETGIDCGESRNLLSEQ
jgi:hypothetical protein